MPRFLSYANRPILRVSLILPFLLLAPSIAHAQQASNTAPSSLKSFLDHRFPRWRFAKIPEAIHRYLIEHPEPARPDLIKGDFDGDGKTDYAVYIVYGRASRRRSSVVALLRRGRTYKPYVLESSLYTPEAEPSEANGAFYIGLVKKGARDYDFPGQRYFTYRHDAVFIGIFEKAGTSYVYERGRFKPIITSD